jgi:phage terminase large subunit-like protein
MNDDAPDPSKIMKLARQAMSSAEYRRKFHMADFWSPTEFYEPQMRFFAEGARRHQRLIRGGNQVGKSFACAFEASLHMTGQYPRWWTGRRFSKPTRGWVVGPERTLVRDGPQKQLTAKQGEFGSGLIPLAAFAGKPVMVPGGGGCIDTMSVAHETEGKRDGISTATFKSFEQGSEKMQAESVDWVWIDERCSEEIYSELMARTTATDGIVFLSYTPLKGGGELTYRFLNEYSADRADIRIDAAEAKHISAARRAELEESYLPHEREARIHGIPQLGIAHVFPFPIESLMRPLSGDNREIKSWARYIVGFDFGFGHPAAAALCAWVNEPEEFIVVDGFRMERAEAFTHVKRIASMCRGLRIPIAWPHDGHQHEKGSGIALADVYRRLGAPMLASHAENKGGGYHVEPAIEEMCGYMKREQFGIANHMTELAEEILSYHRDEDYKIVKLRDDLISAVRYAFMSRRSGKVLGDCETYGRAPGADPSIYDPRPPRPERRETEFARGTAGHPDGTYDVFAGR